MPQDFIRSHFSSQDHTMRQTPAASICIVLRNTRIFYFCTTDSTLNKCNSSTAPLSRWTSRDKSHTITAVGTLTEDEERRAMLCLATLPQWLLNICQARIFFDFQIISSPLNRSRKNIMIPSLAFRSSEKVLDRESGWEARQTLWQIPDPSLPVLNFTSQNMLKDDEVARFLK
jgi:hypothetical protein